MDHGWWMHARVSHWLTPTGDGCHADDILLDCCCWCRRTDKSKQAHVVEYSTCLLPTVPAPIDTKYAAQVNVQSPNRLQTHTNTELLLLQRWMLLATEWIWSKQMAMLGGTARYKQARPRRMMGRCGSDQRRRREPLLEVWGLTWCCGRGWGGRWRGEAGGLRPPAMATSLGSSI